MLIDRESDGGKAAQSSRTAAEGTKRFRVIPRAFSFLDRQEKPGAADRLIYRYAGLCGIGLLVIRRKAFFPGTNCVGALPRFCLNAVRIR